MSPGIVPGLETLHADSAALASAASAAEEALQLERDALSSLREGWSGDSASAAADFIDSHCREGEAVVAALRHAAEVLATLGDSLGGVPVGDSAVAAQDQAQTRLADRAPSSFASPVPPGAPASAPPMAWPAIPMPALPDLGGAISSLVAAAVDAFGGDPGVSSDPGDPVTPADPASPVAQPVAKSAIPPAPAVTPAAPVTPEAVAAAPLLAAEMPREMPTEIPPQDSAPVEATVADRTPCEIAADELPQVGQ